MLDKIVFDDKQRIQEEIRNPYVVINNALDGQFAEDLRGELIGTKIWRDQGDTTMSEKAAQRVLDSFKYSRKGITLGDSTNPAKLLALYNYLNSSELLAWMTQISGRRCDFFEGSATLFGPGDHITKHNDVYTRKKSDGKIQSRALTFNYWLTKDWSQQFGGRLVWEKPYAEIIPSFNRLVLFLPTQLSQHWVETVADNVTVPRLAISGWFMTERSNIEREFQLNLD